MKVRIKTIVRNAIFLFGLVLIFNILSSVMEKKSILISKGSFFKQAKEYDVLFLGSSHMKNAVYPMELWADYGMTSYNLGIPGSQMARNYWTMKNALDYADPKLVVIDVSAIWRDIKMDEVESVHRNLDFFPMTRTKWEAIDDLFTPDARDPLSYDYEKRKWEFVFNFLIYHNRWSEINRLDMHYTQNPEKGGGLFPEIADEVSYILVPKEEIIPQDNISIDYLCKAIEECQTAGMEVLLTYVPSPINRNLQRDINYVQVIAEKYDVNFLNFMYVEDLLNYKTDFHDMSRRGGHLNPSGARKLTSYLGAYIIENYPIEDRRQNPEFAHWDQDYEKYVAYKIKTMRGTQTITEYFSMLPDPKMDVIIYVKPDSQIYQDKKIKAVVKNIAAETSTASVFGKEVSEEYLLVADRMGNAKYESNRLEQTAEFETALSDMTAGIDENGFPYLYLNQEEVNWLGGSWETPENVPDVQVVCVDHITKSVVDAVGYRKKGSNYQKVVSVKINNAAEEQFNQMEQEIEME